jgi:hypothetical protein
MVIRHRNGPPVFALFPANHRPRIPDIAAVEFVVDEVAADDGRAGVGEVDFGLVEEFVDGAFEGFVEVVGGV